MKWVGLSGCWFPLFHIHCNWYKWSGDDAVPAHCRSPRSLSPPPTSGWVMGMCDEVGGLVWMLVPTVPPPTSACVMGMCDEVGGLVWMLVPTVPPPTSACVMGMCDEVGGLVWMLVPTVPHSLQLVQVVCR